MSKKKQEHVVVIGGGFTGLAAAYELTRNGVKVTVCEADTQVGGLAAGFAVGETQLERFYHHWFTNDRYITELVEELGIQDQLITCTTPTGMYYAQNLYRLSKPMDILRFTPLSFLGRLRLGMMVLQARLYKDWRYLDQISAVDWLKRLGGVEVFRVVWEPLLIGKFGRYADQISAAWFWAKLALRGGSRGKSGQERLLYFKGGFGALTNHVADFIRNHGGNIRLSTTVTGLVVDAGRSTGIRVGSETINCDAVIITPALPIIADLLAPHVSAEYTRRLRKVEYLANLCLILQLDCSLSEFYWMNVNDPSFPFVGVIEHTNFQPPVSYAGRHIVYLSKYLTVDNELYKLGDKEILEFALPHLRRMFPDFKEKAIKGFHVWRARYAQPIVVCGYRGLLPEHENPIEGLYIASMAQIYPEDRGTNYAIRDGRKVAGMVCNRFSQE